MNLDILYKMKSSFLDFKYITLMINDMEYIKYTPSNEDNNLVQTNLLSEDKNIKLIKEFVYIPVEYIYLNENTTNSSQLFLKMKLPNYSNVLIPYFYTYKENKILEIKKKHLKKEKNTIILDILPVIVNHLKSYHYYQDYSCFIRILISQQKPNNKDPISSFNICNENKFKYYTYFDIVCKVKYSIFNIQILSPSDESLEINKKATIPDDNVEIGKNSNDTGILSSILLFGFICIPILTVYIVIFVMKNK